MRIYYYCKETCTYSSLLKLVILTTQRHAVNLRLKTSVSKLTYVYCALLKVVGTLSDLILTGLEARKEAGGERWLMVTHCCSLFLCHILTTLVPVEAALQVFNNRSFYFPFWKENWVLRMGGINSVNL